MRIARPARVVLSVVSVAALAACADPKNNPYASSAKSAPPGPPPVVDGVHPDAFDCKKFLPEAQVAQATAAAVTWQAADMPGSPGTPKPCVYVAEVQPPPPPDAGPRKGSEPPPPVPQKGIVAWQYHLDCRPVAVGDAQAIIASLSAQDGSKPVTLGRGALDHSNARVIAIDDDTDCAAYVVGPDETTRSALAKLVLATLDKTNMPKTPRAR
jgi:hypothetical protein